LRPHPLPLQPSIHHQRRISRQTKSFFVKWWHLSCRHCQASFQGQGSGSRQQRRQPRNHHTSHSCHGEMGRWSKHHKFRGEVESDVIEHRQRILCRTKNPWCSLVFRGPTEHQGDTKVTPRKQFPWCSLMFKRKCVGKRLSVQKESVQEFSRCNKCLQRN
jgi:hypothetical protein